MKFHTLALSSSLLLLCATMVGRVNAQSTCTVGAVDQSTLASTTYIVGSVAYTFGFCSSVNPAATTLTRCSSGTGYLQVHSTTNNSCLSNYNTIVSSIAQVQLTNTTTGITYILSDGTTTNLANVTMTCSTTATTTAANLQSVSSNTTAAGVTTTTLALESKAACALSNFFCDAATQCSDASKTCENGVCFDKTCARVTPLTSQSTSDSTFVSQVYVDDCHGTPLANLTNTSFDVSLNAVSINENPYNNEVVTLIESAPAAAPSITTLMLDQSRSVTTGAQATLIAAAKTFVSTVQASNPSHFVAVIAFDGAARPVVVLQHTNDAAAINAALDSLPPNNLTDPGSTNLYGAVKDGVRISNQMRFSFGAANTTVISTMVLFTDGYDTAGRVSQGEAIIEAKRFANTVRIISIGVLSTSDTTFLAAVATSGFFSFPSTSQLVSSFSDIANRVASVSSSNYNVGLCIPIRGSSAVSVGVTLNATQGFTMNSFSTFSVNTSAFTGGCSNTTLAALATQMTTNRSASDTSILHTLTVNNSIVTTIPAEGAVFAQFTFTEPNIVVAVSATAPSTTVSALEAIGAITIYYVDSNNCKKVSPYCNDGVFNTSFVPTTGTHYNIMVTSSLSLDQPITIVATGSTSAPPTAVPGTIPTAVPLIFTPTPGTVLGRYDGLNYSLAGVSDTDIDEPGAWVFFGFLIAGVFALVLLVGSFMAGRFMEDDDDEDEDDDNDNKKAEEMRAAHNNLSATRSLIMSPRSIGGMSGVADPRFATPVPTSGMLSAPLVEGDGCFSGANPYRSSAGFGSAMGGHDHSSLHRSRSAMMSARGIPTGHGEVPRLTPLRGGDRYNNQSSFMAPAQDEGGWRDL